MRERSERSRFERIMWPAIALLVPIGVTTITTMYLEKKNEREVRSRAYLELLSKREDSESTLRKDMFRALVDKLFEEASLTNSQSVDNEEAMVLYLELITYNFHESLHLSPLFLAVNNRIANLEGDEKEQLQTRLRKLSQKAVSKQVETLRRYGSVDEHSFKISEVLEGLIEEEMSGTVLMYHLRAGLDAAPEDWSSTRWQALRPLIFPDDSLNNVVMDDRAWTAKGLLRKRVLEVFLGSFHPQLPREIWGFGFEEKEWLSDEVIEQKEPLSDSLSDLISWKVEGLRAEGELGSDFCVDANLKIVKVDNYNKEVELQMETLPRDCGAEADADDDPASEAGDDDNGKAERKFARFHVGLFDFPMIDNTRLSKDYRLSVFIKKWNDEEGEVKLGIAVFPGYVSGMREKAFLKDVLEDLRPE